MLPFQTAVEFPVPPPAISRPATPDTGQSQPETCIPAALSRDAKVIILGMNGGKGAPSPIKLVNANRRFHTVSVTGHESGKVVLVLEASEPTVWDISQVAGRVRAVLATGFYPQALAGASPDTSTHFFSTIGGGPDRSDLCSGLDYVTTSPSLELVEGMAKTTRSLTGRRPSRFFGGFAPTSFDIDGGPGSLPRMPRPEDIRTGVSYLTVPDSEITALAREKVQYWLADRIVEWDDKGEVVRDQGESGPLYRANKPADGRSTSHSPTVPDLMRLGLMVLLGGFGHWLWTRRRKPVIEPLAISNEGGPLQPNIQFATSAQHTAAFAPESQLDQIASLAELTESEPLILALHRYNRMLRSVRRTAFDADLADEMSSIATRHFGHAASRYRQGRPTLDGAEAEEADATLRRSVGRLTVRLADSRTSSIGATWTGSTRRRASSKADIQNARPAAHERCPVPWLLGHSRHQTRVSRADEGANRVDRGCGHLRPHRAKAPGLLAPDCRHSSTKLA